MEDLARECVNQLVNTGTYHGWLNLSFLEHLDDLVCCYAIAPELAEPIATAILANIQDRPLFVSWPPETCGIVHDGLADFLLEHVSPEHPVIKVYIDECHAGIDEYVQEHTDVDLGGIMRNFAKPLFEKRMHDVIGYDPKMQEIAACCGIAPWKRVQQPKEQLQTDVPDRKYSIFSGNIAECVAQELAEHGHYHHVLDEKMVHQLTNFDKVDTQELVNVIIQSDHDTIVEVLKNQKLMEMLYKNMQPSDMLVELTEMFFFHANDFETRVRLVKKWKSYLTTFNNIGSHQLHVAISSVISREFAQPSTFKKTDD